MIKKRAKLIKGEYHEWKEDRGITHSCMDKDIIREYALNFKTYDDLKNNIAGINLSGFKIA